MTLEVKPRGPEAVANRIGRCRLCPRPIRAGQAVLKVEPLGWVHTPCGDGYRRVIEEHGEDREEGR